MDPVTIALGLSAVGSGMSVFGSLYEGRAAEQAAAYNAAIARRNAAIARQQGAENARRVRIEGVKQLGSMRANYGASGVTMEGSPMEVLAASASAVEMDALTVRYNAELKAIGYESDAAMELYRGETGKQSSYYSAAASLLRGGASIAGMSGGSGSTGGSSSTPMAGESYSIERLSRTA